MYLTCKRGSVGQSEGLSIPRSSVRFRLKPENSNSHEFELHRPSNKGTKLLLKVIKAIIIIIYVYIYIYIYVYTCTCTLKIIIDLPIGFPINNIISTCKRGSVGQSEGLSIPRSSVRFRLKPDTSNSHEFELHRPSNKGTKLLLKVIKAIIIIITEQH